VEKGTRTARENKAGERMFNFETICPDCRGLVYFDFREEEDVLILKANQCEDDKEAYACFDDILLEIKIKLAK
jgi:hypothetical protein